jgi:TonB-dependent starch-binding outer membrane protein SusC
LKIQITRQEEKILRQVPDSVDFGFFSWRPANISRSYSVSFAEPFEESYTELSDRLHSLSGSVAQNEGIQPGSLPSLIIRGRESAFTNQPLYIIDGIMMNAGLNLPLAFSAIDPLWGLNMKDIDNISVLKDNAATALYGSGGANGVVLIHTKRGEADSLLFTYHMQTGMQSPLSRKTEMMHSEAYFSMLDESLAAAGYEPQEEGVVLNEMIWSDDMMRSGLFTDHTLSVSGGTQKSNLYLSGNLKSDRGVVSGSGINSGGLRLNHMWRPVRWFNTGIHLGFTQLAQDAVITPGSRFGSNPFAYASVYPPVSKANLAAWPSLHEHFGGIDPAEFLKEHTIKNSASQFDGNFSFQLKFGNYFSLNSSTGGSYNDFGQVYNLPCLADDFSFAENYIKKYQTSWVYNWRALNYLRFEKLDGKSHWLFLLGSEERYQKAGTDINYQIHNRGGEIPKDNYRLAGGNSRRISAFFAQADYAYDELLDIEFVLRREELWRQDGTNLYGIFPAFSSGLWIYRNKQTQNPAFSSLKLKAGWGVPGADPFHYLHYTWHHGDATEFDYQAFALGLPAEASAPVARWEVSEEWNFGLQSWWLGNDLLIDVNYFNRLRSNVAYLFSNPENTTNHYEWGHTGRILNSGFELELSYRKDFGNMGFWGNAFIQSAQNRLLSFGSDYLGDQTIEVYPEMGYQAAILKVGEPAGAFTGYLKEGIFQTQGEVEAANMLDGDPTTWYQHQYTAPGDIKFADLDNNGKIDENDMTVTGSPYPALTYGITSGAAYGNFDLFLFFDGALGYDILDLNQTWSHASGGWGNRATEFNSRWKPLMPSLTLPRVHFDDPNQNNRLHSGMVRQSHYFRLKKIDIGYRFSLKKKFQYARVYFLSENLFTVTNYHGNSSFPGGNLYMQGIDYGRYPGSVLFAVGLQLGL